MHAKKFAYYIGVNEPRVPIHIVSTGYYRLGPATRAAEIVET